MKMIFRPENLTVSYTADQEGYKTLGLEVRGLKDVLYTEQVGSGKARLPGKMRDSKHQARCSMRGGSQ